MSWQETKVSEEKLMFINDWLKQEYTHTALYERYQISRPTGYDLIKRFKEEGVASFTERSRAPLHIPHKTPDLIEAKLLELKYRYPTRGPSMIRDFVIKEGIEGAWPAASKIGEIFKQQFPPSKQRCVAIE
jgi:hypothetical protein